MKYRELILQSKADLETNPPHIDGAVSAKVFDLGAKWMYDKLNEKEAPVKVEFDDSINFFAYGLLKYSLSFFVFIVSAFFFFKINFLLLPLSVILFYFVEVHFLFLFPILIDNVANPIRTSIKQTYKTGILTALITVIPIGFFMMYGLLDIKNPLRNWYIGCLAIITWYQNEVRNRI